jgi:hypothetical protein
MVLWRFHSLRSRLALFMSIAAMAPLSIVSVLASQIVLQRLEHGLSDQLRQTGNIAMNLLLRQVKQTSAATASLAATAELHELLAIQPRLIPEYLARNAESVAPLVEVVDRQGNLVARSDGEAASHRSLHSMARTVALRRALQYERYMTVELVGGRLAIQAAEPVIDDQFTLLGAVISTMPMDDKFADYIKGVVGAEVGFLRPGAEFASTLRDSMSATDATFEPAQSVSDTVLGGRVVQRVRRLGETEYSLAYVPLQTVGGTRIGIMAVGLDRRELLQAKRSATQFLLVGAAAALLLSLVGATILGRRRRSAATTRRGQRRRDRLTRSRVSGDDHLVARESGSVGGAHPRDLHLASNRSHGVSSTFAKRRGATGRHRGNGGGRSGPGGTGPGQRGGTAGRCDRGLWATGGT